MGLKVKIKIKMIPHSWSLWSEGPLASWYPSVQASYTHTHTHTHTHLKVELGSFTKSQTDQVPPEAPHLTRPPADPTLRSLLHPLSWSQGPWWSHLITSLFQGFDWGAQGNETAASLNLIPCLNRLNLVPLSAGSYLQTYP